MTVFCRLGSVVLVALCLSACALTEDTVNIQYHPMTAISAVPGAPSVVIAVAVLDARTEHRDRVSVKKNGYGMEMAAIRSDRDVPQIVKESIETELKARGFRVGDSAAQAKVDLIAFYNDFKIGFFSGDAVAQVSFNVQVIGAGRHDPLFEADFVNGQGAGHPAGQWIERADGTRKRLAGSGREFDGRFRFYRRDHESRRRQADAGQLNCLRSEVLCGSPEAGHFMRHQSRT